MSSPDPFGHQSILVQKRYSCPQCGRVAITSPLGFQFVAANCSQEECPLKHQARDNRRGCFGLVLVFGVGIIGLSLWDLGTSDTKLSVNDQSLNFAAEEPGDEADQSAAPIDAEISALETDPGTAEELPAESLPLAVSPRDTAEVPLREAIQLALSTGRPVRWREGEGKGYVVVSEAAASMTIECKSVAVRTDGSAQDVSKGTWCRNGLDRPWAERGS